MKNLLKSTVLLAFFAASLSALAQKPEPVYSFVRQMHDFDWYETQAKLWKQEIDNGTTNAMAWVYWYEANRTAAIFCNAFDKWESKRGDYFVLKETILQSAEKFIPNTFEYWYLKGRIEEVFQNPNDDSIINSIENEYKSIFKAQEIRPFDNLLFPFLMNYYILKNDKINIKLICQKWFESNEMPEEILTTLYNMLISLEKNAILLVNGDNDTYPCWVLQNAKNIRPDVLVLNISFACGIKQYRENMFKENKIDSIAGGNDSTFYVPERILLKHLTKNIKDRPLYVSCYVGQDIYQDYANKMYLTGLALKYSEKSFNNLAVLRDNVENKFLLDFLKESFHTSYAQNAINQINSSYLSVFLKLYNYYKQNGEKEKALKMKDLAAKITKNAGNEEYMNYFEK